MGDIRRQTIFSSLLIYVGFVFGALNTYLFTREGFFTPDQYGLTQAIIAINMTFYAFANFGSVAIMGRFYPVYYGQLKKRDTTIFFHLHFYWRYWTGTYHCRYNYRQTTFRQEIF
jgi:O-antigen/teichoic acid export membrane protein